jgi:hypothetical protein
VAKGQREGLLNPGFCLQLRHQRPLAPPITAILTLNLAVTLVQAVLKYWFILFPSYAPQRPHRSHPGHYHPPRRH